MDVSLTWRYYDSVELFRGDPARIDFELDSVQLLRPGGRWAVNEKSSVLLGINNFLDEDPPITQNVGTTGNGNTFPQTYDATGQVHLPARQYRVLILV